MFILRRITSENKQSNTVLGERYVYIEKERNPEDYEIALSTFNKKVDNDIYGFISSNDGTKLLPLYKKSTYFIMLSNGKTFDNLTFK